MKLRMRESYSEIVAECAGPESYADDGNIVGVATAGVHAGPEIELRYQAIPCADTVRLVEGNIEPIVNGEIGLERGGSARGHPIRGQPHARASLRSVLESAVRS